MKRFSWIYFCFLLLAGCSWANKQTIAVVSDSKQTAEKQSSLKMLRKVIEETRTGKVVNCVNLLGTNIKKIPNTWGKHDRNNMLIQYKYLQLSYDFHHKVEQITTYNPSLHQISLTDILQILGKPVDEYNDEGDHLVYYVVGNYQIWFGLDATSKTKSNPHVKYYYIGKMY